MNKKFEEAIWAYTLKNSLEHGGVPNTGSVVAGLHHDFPKSQVINNVPNINKVISKVKSLSLPKQQLKFKEIKFKPSKRKTREGLAELPGAKKGKVVMRFAPSASGPFHIAHALTACLSFLYVQKYGGKFYIRIEDTNPDNIYKPAYKMIQDESRWLFNKKAKIMIQSDRMTLYYKYAKMLIKKNTAYVCTCSQDKFKGYVGKKKNCPCRDIDVKENQEKWKKMLDKKGYDEGKAVLRFKSDMKDKNPAMRDFPLARINLRTHPRKGKKYRVWPLMNLAVSVDDIEMKMTHVIRGKDHRDNAIRQEKIHKVLGKKSPWVAFIGRIKFKNMELSATKIREAVENKKYKGWDDPRLPTIASLKKQGYRPQAFWKFSEHIGLSKADKVTDKREFFKLLDSFNK